MALFKKGQNFVSILQRYETFGEALTGTYEKYSNTDKITAKDIRYLAREVNKGVEYALLSSKRNNISGYQLYRDAISVIKQEFKKAGINYNEIFNVTKKSFSVNTSKKDAQGRNISLFNQYTQSQKRTIAAAFEYLRRSPFTSKSGWEFYSEELAEQAESNAIKTMWKKYKISPVFHEKLMRVFMTPQWQEIRKKTPYEEFDTQLIVEYLEKTQYLSDDELTQVLQSFNIVEMMDKIDEILSEESED